MGLAMRARELELLLGELTPRSKSDLDIRMRKLREAKLLPTGGRGPNAPHISPREAATMLIAICCSRQAVDAADAVSVFASLLAKWTDEAFEGAGTFAEALTVALARPEAARRIDHVLFSLPGKLDAKFSMGFPFCVISCPPHKYYYVTKEWFYDEVLDGPKLQRRSSRKENPSTHGTVRLRNTMLSDDTTIKGDLIVELARRLTGKAGAQENRARKKIRASRR
jgi:hypothetical protein